VRPVPDDGGHAVEVLLAEATGLTDLFDAWTLLVVADFAVELVLLDTEGLFDLWNTKK